MTQDPSVQSVSITRYDTQHDTNSQYQLDDAVSIEAPLEIHINAQPWTMTMRTPGNDEHLVRGLLFSEGLISSTSDIHEMQALRCENAKATRTMQVSLAHVDSSVFNRSLRSTASCGLCGKTSFSDEAQAKIKTQNRLSSAQVKCMLDIAKQHQADFDITGGLHAAAAFSLDGNMLAIHEDIGRHNALDKLIGHLLQDDILDAPCLVLSGRVSWEMIQKASRYGFSHVMAVSAPSSMAIDMAQRHGITLMAWCRKDRFSVYTHAHAITETVSHES